MCGLFLQAPLLRLYFDVRAECQRGGETIMYSKAKLSVNGVKISSYVKIPSGLTPTS